MLGSLGWADWLQSSNVDPEVSEAVQGSNAWPTGPSVPGLAESRWDAEHGLWRDPELLDVPFEKSLRMLAALVHRLERLNFPGSAWFRSAVEQAADDPTGGFLDAWRDPQAFQWTRHAWRLLADSQAHVDGRLDRWLTRFQRFTLDAALRAGETLTLTRPIPVDRGFSLLGGQSTLLCDEPLALQGAVDGDVRVVHRGMLKRIPTTRHSEPGLVVQEAPIAWYDGLSLPLNPWAFDHDGLDFAAPLLDYGLAEQSRWQPTLERSLAVVDRCAPELFDHYRRLMRFMAFKPRSSGSYDDFSHPDLPGACALSGTDNPLELGDHLIHEFQHNRLSLLEESGPLFASMAEAEADCRFYSPWREKTRGLYGIFHGVYVFTAVTRYWAAVYRDPWTTSRDRPYVVDRLLRLPVQLELARDVLRRHGRWTPLGSAVFDQLSRDVDSVQAVVSQLRLPADAWAWKAALDGSYLPETHAGTGQPLTVRSSLAEHHRRNDSHHTCPVGSALFAESAAA